MEKKAKAEAKRARRTKLKQDAADGVTPMHRVDEFGQPINELDPSANELDSADE
jgi:hypothetical protein